MARIYISSASLDLGDERRAAREAIRRLGHHGVGMEDYGASETRPAEVCTTDVATCKAYVGIVAWRYGHVPPQGTGLSITEMEYEAAGACGIPRLIYLSPERPTWKQEWIDPDYRKVDQFRARVRERMIWSFKDAGELEKQILADVPRHLPSEAT